MTFIYPSPLTIRNVRTSRPDLMLQPETTRYRAHDQFGENRWRIRSTPKSDPSKLLPVPSWHGLSEQRSGMKRWRVERQKGSMGIGDDRGRAACSAAPDKLKTRAHAARMAIRTGSGNTNFLFMASAAAAAEGSMPNVTRDGVGTGYRPSSFPQTS